MISEIDFPDIPISASWSWDGGKLAVSCKDRKLRIMDPRSGRTIRVGLKLSTLKLINDDLVVKNVLNN